MTVWDAPISQPYGYDPNYQGNAAHFHYGVDYAAPEGTPITVNGVTIGLVGHTGRVYDQNGQNTINAAHLHVGHYRGAVAVSVSAQQGKQVSGARVTEVGEDATNGKFVRVADADGSSWVYLHMSKQLARVGDILSEEEEMLNRGDVINFYKLLLGRDPSEQEIKIYEGKPFKETIYAFMSSDEFKKRVSGSKPINKGDVINYLTDNLK